MVSLADPRLNPAGFDFRNTSFTVEAWIKPAESLGSRNHWGLGITGVSESLGSRNHWGLGITGVWS